jgi:transposase
MSNAALQIAELSAALAAQTARAQASEAELARALASCTETMIEELKLEIAELRHDKYGISSKRLARLINQLELHLEELAAAATEDALVADAATDKTSTVRAFTRRKPVRKPFADHLPRERVVIEAPTNCTCCGSDRIVKIGQHQPLNHQAERIAREGIDLSLSTLADLIGHDCVALAPIHALIERHVLNGGRLHDDDATVPLLARGCTKTARLWTYVRDDRIWIAARRLPPSSSS